jgi:pimeloyl-ACP methyl ester carboxylesterase
MIVATKQLLEKLQVTHDDKLFLMGYSEGGYATLATLELLNSGYKNLKVTASAPMAGSYDLTRTADIILAQDSYEEAHLPIFLIYSYYKYYGLGDLSTIFVDNYATKIEEYFRDKREGKVTDIELPKKRDELYKDSFIQEYFSSIDTPLKAKLKENSLIDWKPSMPMRLYHCKADKVVPAENSQIAYESFIQNEAENVELILKDGGSHSSCSLPFYIDAIDWFGEF